MLSVSLSVKSESMYLFHSLVEISVMASSKKKVLSNGGGEVTMGLIGRRREQFLLLVIKIIHGVYSMLNCDICT